MRPSFFRPQSVMTGAGLALPEQEKLSTVYAKMSRAELKPSAARLLPICPIVCVKNASGRRTKMQLVVKASIAGCRLLVNNEINRQLNARRLALVCVIDYCDGE